MVKKYWKLIPIEQKIFFAAKLAFFIGAFIWLLSSQNTGFKDLKEQVKYIEQKLDTHLLNQK